MGQAASTYNAGINLVDDCPRTDRRRASTWTVSTARLHRHGAGAGIGARTCGLRRREGAEDAIVDLSESTRPTRSRNDIVVSVASADDQADVTPP